MSHPLESALASATKWTFVTAVASVPLLAVPASWVADHRLVVVTTHLSIVVGLATTLAWRLSSSLDEDMFQEATRPWLAAAAAMVALVTGFAALVTLASSAALRYDPSLQFLQLLSALDVAWSAAALGYGARRLTASPRWGVAAAAMLDVVCVASIWNYLRTVGFDPAGGWVVDRSALLTLVIPFDVAAALMAIGSLLAAERSPDPVTLDSSR